MTLSVPRVVAEAEEFNSIVSPARAGPILTLLAKLPFSATSRLFAEQWICLSENPRVSDLVAFSSHH
jgi:hypothetical protein